LKKTICVILAAALALSLFAACTEPRPLVHEDATIAGQDFAGTQETQNTPAQDIAPPAGQNPSDASSFDADRVIAVLTREDGSGTRDAFVSTTGVGEDMYVEAIVFNETNQILTNVATNEFAIGYVSVGSLNDSVKAVSIDGVAPSDATIMDGSYAVQRPLLVCVNEENIQNELVQDFIAFMLSAQGQAISGSRWTPVDANPPQYTPSGLSGVLRVGGSTSVEPLMQAMRQAYIALNPGVEIEISGGGSGTGISEARSGIIDIGMSSRALRDGEREDLIDIDIALDGVAIIVNQNNPIDNMSIEQVQGIFTGAITRWSGVQ